MANHVNSRFHISCNEDALKIVEQWVSRVESYTGGYEKPVTLIRTDFDPEDGADYSWYIENIGSKWCYIEECYTSPSSEQDGFISTVSAWDYPHQLGEWMCEQLLAVDPDAQILVEYDDEMPNFIGVHNFSARGDFGESINYDDLVEGYVPALEGSFSEDEEWEHIQEHIWEATAEWFAEHT